MASRLGTGAWHAPREVARRLRAPHIARELSSLGSALAFPLTFSVANRLRVEYRVAFARRASPAQGAALSEWTRSVCEEHSTLNAAHSAGF
eukprot:6190745-Pleurochrysis_carterae.AAC.4